MVGEAPVVDTTSNEVGTNYDRSWVENAPLRRDSFFDLVAGAPGSLQGGDSNNTTRTMVYGSSYDENSFQVDGVDITDNYFNEALGRAQHGRHRGESRSCRWARRPSTAT